MKPFKNRKIDRSKPVRVYRNLNRKDVWYSIAQKVKGRWLVFGHSQFIILKYVTPKVSKAGSDRVKADKERNVHAYLEGLLIKKYQTKISDRFTQIYYNPYTCECFVWKKEEKPEFKFSQIVVLNQHGVMALQN